MAQSHWPLRDINPLESSRVNEKDIEDINEEEFVAPCFSDYPEIWDTLGEPSGRYNFMVKYTPTPTINEVVLTEEQLKEYTFPSIWDSTPWEDDPEWDIDELPEPPPEPEIQEYEEEENPETYFLGLQNLETDYPTSIPDPTQQPIYWESSDAESEAY
ncbi:hypothetical protein ZIOFF_013697 [Zingiber officinale]|uniref:Uncharacterized protein n=1 Tax=Zingiber officinale TaxID=94328 RepID=A0A8J5H9G2_ZINOF|nr:hypothetical protein ZIOFF_013697 [Zingiber officinale]